MDKAQFFKTLEILQSHHAETYKLILQLREQANGISNEDIVDISFALRSLSELHDDIRKELNSAREFIGKIACIRWIQESVNLTPEEMALSIHGEYAKGIPKVMTMASLPREKTNPEDYLKFMKRIGVFGQALKRGLVKVSWPAVTEYITDLTAKGKPLPPGIDPDKTYTLYNLRIVKKTTPRREGCS